MYEKVKIVLLIVSLLQISAALPPEYFRNGRSSGSTPKSLLSEICEHCAIYGLNYFTECALNIGGRRIQCLMIYNDDRRG